MVWPEFYEKSKFSAIPIIFLSLLIEFFFFKKIFKLNMKKGILYSITANTVSGMFGIILKPIFEPSWLFSSGSYLILFLKWHYIYPDMKFFTFITLINGFLNTVLELLTIKLIWREKIGVKIFLLTWCINIITVSIAIYWMVT